MSWLAFAFSYAGVACFAFAMAVHHRTCFGCPPGRGRAHRFRLAGIVLLTAALAASIRAFGWQVGIVAWVSLLSVSGFALTQLLAYAPRLALAPLGGLLVPALLAAVWL